MPVLVSLCVSVCLNLFRFTNCVHKIAFSTYAVKMQSTRVNVGWTGVQHSGDALQLETAGLVGTMLQTILSFFRHREGGPCFLVALALSRVWSVGVPRVQMTTYGVTATFAVTFANPRSRS